MSIEYELSLNKLTTPDSYAARVRPRATTGTAALAAAIAGSSTMSEADVAGVLMALAAQVQTELLAGNWVQIDGLGILTTSVKARLATITDPLPSDASIEIGYRADSTLREQVQTQASFERIEATDQSPLLLTLTAQTGPGLGGVGPGDVLQFIGDRMKVRPAASDEGVFFTDATGTATRVTNYLHNTDKELQFAVPSGLTPATSYTVQVRARVRGSNTLRSTTWGTPVAAG